MFSKLSPGVTNASYYNQAARNVACMAEAARCAGARPEQLDILGFYVVAPASQLEEFSKQMARDSIVETVKRRVDEYKGGTDEWYHHSFTPIAEKAEIRTVAWEDVTDDIIKIDPDFGDELTAFYDNCLQFNRPDSGR